MAVAQGGEQQILPAQNIVQLLRWRASQRPHQTLYRFLRAGELESSLTYGELDTQARSVAAVLQQCGKAGDRALILLPHTLEYLSAFFGTLYAGMTAVPSFPPSRAHLDGTLQNVSRIVKIIHDASPAFVFVSSRIRQKLSDAVAAPNGSEPIQWIEIEEIGTHHAHEWTEPYIEPDALAHLQYTSGSTSSPKAVMISHANALANLEMIRTSFGLSEHSVGVSWLPFFHDMGLANVLSAIYAGFPFILMAPSDFTRRPYRWLKAISDYSATVSGGPNFAFELCANQCSDAERASLNLKSWTMAFNGAEPVKADTLEQFTKTFASCGFQASALRVCYGLAEATVLGSVVTPEAIHRVRTFSRSQLEKQIAVSVTNGHGENEEVKYLASCGNPPLRSTIAIVNPDTLEELPSGKIGEVWVGGAHVARGYWNRLDETEQIFGVTLPGRSETFLRTGDLGFRCDGELFVTGRRKDLLIMRGRNFYPQDFEQIAVQAGYERAAAFAVERNGSEHLVLVCETARLTNNSDDIEAAAKIRHRVFENFELRIYGVVFVKPRSLPLSSSGKIQRYLCRDLFLSDQLESIYADLTDEDLKSRSSLPAGNTYLLKYEADLKSDRTLEDIGVDSMDLAHLAYEFEKHFPGFEHEKIDLTALYRLTVRECFELFSDPTPERFEVIWAKLSENRHREVDSIIRADALLQDFEVPRELSANGSGGEIFLTGATGFVGTYLLNELLLRTGDKVSVLVRSHDKVGARTRIEESFVRYGLLDQRVSEALRSRVSYFAGDLERPRFGLPESEWMHIASGAKTILHNGANVNYVSPYSKMKAANVDGTQEILNLAVSQRLKALHYVSSTFVFGWATKFVYENDRNPTMNDVDFGYSESKWAGEQLVWQAFDRGLPGRIYRPAMLTASSRGEFSTSDITAALLLYFINYGVSLAMPNQISIMPIDFFARRFVDFMLLENTDDRAFHFTMPYSNVPEICAAITRQFGYEFQPLSLMEFSGHLRKHCGPDDLFFPFVNFYQRHFKKIELMAEKRYVREAYESTCQREFGGTNDPRIEDVVRYIILFFKKHRLITAASKFDEFHTRESHLENRVANE